MPYTGGFDGAFSPTWWWLAGGTRVPPYVRAWVASSLTVPSPLFLPDLLVSRRGEREFVQARAVRHAQGVGRAIDLSDRLAKGAHGLGTCCTAREVGHRSCFACPEQSERRRHQDAVTTRELSDVHCAVVCMSSSWLQERTNLFARYAHRRARTGVDAAAAVRAAFERQRSGGSDGGAEAEEQGIKQRPIGEDSDCVICFDPLKGHGAIVWCKTGCGHSLHKACIDAWSRQKRAERNQVTCPYCRADWPETAAGGSSNVAGVTANEGYVNVAQVTGQSTYRPEYHSSGWGYGGGWRKGYRRWRRRW